MQRESQRDLEILSTIAQGEPVTQRGLAQKLGIALGLTNLYLKRLARKGYIKVTTIPRNRIRYLLTAKGFAEKTRLTYEYIEYSLQLYRQTRRALREALRPLALEGHRRVVLYGTGEAAELAYLTLRELGLELTGVADGDEHGGAFLGAPALSLTDLRRAEMDVVVVATFGEDAESINALIAQGIPRDKIISLRRTQQSDIGTGSSEEGAGAVSAF